MENKKKKYLFIGASILAFILVLILVCVCIYCCRFNKPLSIPTRTISVDTIPDDGMYHKKPIKLELMTDTEKDSFGLSTSSPQRAQVLERDASGTPTVYRLIYSDSDILTEY